MSNKWVWQPVEPADVLPGDRALHVLGHDGRTVVKASKRNVWLDILGTTVGPCRKENYTFIRISVREGGTP